MDLNSPDTLSRCEAVIEKLDELYLRAIPRVIQDGTAFISFHPMLALLEGLAGFRFPDVEGEGNKFRAFIESYLPAEYRSHAPALWKLRNGMQHAACPREFDLMHFHPELNLSASRPGTLILDAGAFFEAIKEAALRYFAEVRARYDLQLSMVKRADSSDGGVVGYVPVVYVIKGTPLPPPSGGVSSSGNIAGDW